MKARRQLLSAAILGTALTATAATASAQCSGVCNSPATAGHTWLFSSGIGAGNDTVVLGMFEFSPGEWRPTVCKTDSSGTRWAHGDANARIYTSNALTADTALCLGGGNDVFSVLPPTQTLTCYLNVIGIKVPIAVNGFSYAGHQLTVSGEAGNDELRGAYATNSRTNLCGYTGNDVLVTAGGTDYQNASNGHDYLGANTPASLNVRLYGGPDNDVINTYGDDRFLGDSGADCVVLMNATYNATSSCGAGTDYAESSETVDPPADCEFVAPQGPKSYALDCCQMAGYTCAPELPR